MVALQRIADGAHSSSLDAIVREFREPSWDLHAVPVDPRTKLPSKAYLLPFLEKNFPFADRDRIVTFGCIGIDTHRELQSRHGVAATDAILSELAPFFSHIFPNMCMYDRSLFGFILPGHSLGDAYFHADKLLRECNELFNRSHKDPEQRRYLTLNPSSVAQLDLYIPLSIGLSFVHDPRNPVGNYESGFMHAHHAFGDASRSSYHGKRGNTVKCYVNPRDRD